MKRWFRLTLFCCVLLCLCLSLPQAVGLNHSLQIVGLRSYFDRGTESASEAPTVSVVRRMRFDPARAAPLRSQILDGECEWTASNLGPPGLQPHVPPEPIGHGRVAGQAVKPATTDTSSTLFSPNLLAQTINFSRIGVSQQPLASPLFTLQRAPRYARCKTRGRVVR